MFRFLTLEEILESHVEQIAHYGGRGGIRDLGLIESALAQPQAMFESLYLHCDIFEMAAAYLFHLGRNHPFVDGNKRVGLEAALLFLELNGKSVVTSDESLVELVLDTVEGRADKTMIASFFRANSVDAL